MDHFWSPKSTLLIFSLNQSFRCLWTAWIFTKISYFAQNGIRGKFLGQRMQKIKFHKIYSLDFSEILYHDKHSKERKSDFCFIFQDKVKYKIYIKFSYFLLHLLVFPISFGVKIEVLLLLLTY